MRVTVYDAGRTDPKARPVASYDLYLTVDLPTVPRVGERLIVDRPELELEFSIDEVQWWINADGTTTIILSTRQKFITADECRECEQAMRESGWTSGVDGEAGGE